MTMTPNDLHQSAWHGTPHRGIERFSTDAIGSGEGAQSFGWGLYFTSTREVADHYRASLQGGPMGVNVANAAHKALGVDYDEAASSWRFIDAVRRVAGQGAQAVRQALLREADNMVRSQLSGDQRLASQMRALADNEAVLQAVNDEACGEVYEVAIPGDEHMLLWDTPLRDHPQAVKDALYALPGGHVNYAGARVYHQSPQAWMTGKQVYRNLSLLKEGDQNASRALAAIGVKGIKYLDGDSRAAGHGTYNYVVFDGADVQVVHAAFGSVQTEDTADTADREACSERMRGPRGG